MNGEAGEWPGTILLASYPKAGNTWVRAFLTAYRTGEAPRLDALDARPLFSLRHLFDELTGVASADLTLDEIDLLRPRFHAALAGQAGAPPFVKVHDRWYRNREGEPVFAAPAVRGAVYIARHPAAVAVSFAHHRRAEIDSVIADMAREDALHDWWPTAIDTRLPQRLSSWSTHAASWLDQNEVPVLLVRYEDLSSCPERVFADILAFAGLEVYPQLLAEAIAAASFERLRAEETRGGFEERADSPDFFRRGRPDAFHAELSEAQVRRIERDHRATIQRLGYASRSEAP